MLLGVDADVVAFVPAILILLGGSNQGKSQLLFHGGAEFFNSPLVNQPHQPRFLAVGAGAVIPIDHQDCFTEGHHIARIHPGIEGNGGGHAAGGKEPAHHNVEPKLAVFVGGDEGDVVNFGVNRVVAAAVDRDVEFAGQVGEAGVAITVVGDHVLHFAHQPPGVDQLVGINAGHGGAGDVAHVIHARLDAGEAGAIELLENFRNVIQPNPA